jgi:hypothetical protein
MVCARKIDLKSCYVKKNKLEAILSKITIGKLNISISYCRQRLPEHMRIEANAPDERVPLARLDFQKKRSARMLRNLSHAGQALEQGFPLPIFNPTRLNN